MKNLKKVNNELSIVNKTNELRIKKLNKELIKEKEDINELLNEADKLIINSSKFTLKDAEALEITLSKPQNVKKTHLINIKENSWEKTVNISKKYLISEGINPEEIMSYNILPKDELFKILDYLNRPLYKRIPWDLKIDLPVCFGIGILGGFIDLFMCTPGHFFEKMISDKNSWIGKYMEKIHQLHPKGAAIDYQGKAKVLRQDGTVASGSFGGGSHRARSRAHDPLRIFECIKQLKDGKFEGVFYRDGIKFPFESSVNQYGKKYIPMSLGSAFLNCIIHQFCDFFSSGSLPLPGSTFLFENSDRETRKIIIEELYNRGFNFRHLILQTIPPFVVTVAVIVFFLIKYKNIDAPSDAKLQKLAELMTLSHSITCAFNIGKVIIMKDPWQLNIPQIIATCLSIFSAIILESRRNSFISKIKRNTLNLKTDLDKLKLLVENNIPIQIILE